MPSQEQVFIQVFLVDKLAHASKAFSICKSSYVAIGFFSHHVSTFQSYEIPQLF
jgi:hypothetical protein